ncbi:MAG: hypothetical protein AB7I30_19625 [Isosphaeraceae bacterium]
MNDDAEAKEPSPWPVASWKLPEIVNMKAEKVRYARPRVRYEGTERVEYGEGVEILVETAFELPERAISPALYVGDVALTDYSYEGKNRYRFHGFAPQTLREGAPVRLDWLHERPAEAVGAAPRFQISGEVER